jgi:transposase
VNPHSSTLRHRQAEESLLNRTFPRPHPLGARALLHARGKILGHTGDITRFANADRYASYAGTAPIEVSSGDQRRHRLSRAGNRSLNHALHLAARVQTMHPSPGRTHYARKQAEHKTPAEALRSLKRQLAKVVYRHLRDDHAHQTSPSPRLT